MFKNEMRELIQQINEANVAYYEKDSLIMSDKSYDALFDELLALEKTSCVTLSNSPTQKVGGVAVDFLPKVMHSKPMLSCAKTKSLNEISKFIGNKDVFVSWKLDGLTVVLRYQDGTLSQAITRGSGTEGEDISHNIALFDNVPVSIPIKTFVELRGECVISWDKYEKLGNNEEAHPRNIAGGMVRRLKPIKQNSVLSFKAFELVTPAVESKKAQYDFMTANGFDVVEHVFLNKNDDLAKTVESFNPKQYMYPVDGLIFEYNDVAYGESLGGTGHHEKCRMALKWEDDAVKTKFTGVRMQVTRTGMVSLTAEFEPIKIEHSIVSRATLHNLDFYEGLKLGVGDELDVYLANKIIPAIDKNNTQSGTYKLPMLCPECGQALTIKQPGNARFLYCENPDCSIDRKLEHFCSKPAANIVGLSGATLKTFVEAGLLENAIDIYHLSDSKDEIINLDGMGIRSYEKLIAAIEKSRDMSLAQFVVCLDIPMIGKSAGKAIDKQFKGDVDAFVSACKSGYDFHALPDFGDIMCDNLSKWFSDKDNLEFVESLLWEVLINPNEESDEVSANNIFEGKTMVATGSFKHFTRDSINAKIESLGGKASGSVSKKTDYLISGEKAGSKLNKAMELDVIILSEAEFLEMAG